MTQIVSRIQAWILAYRERILVVAALSVTFGVAVIVFRSCHSKPALNPDPSLPLPAVSAAVESARDEGRAEVLTQQAESLNPAIEAAKTDLATARKATQQKKVDTHALSDSDLAGLWSDAGF
jgi:hypothetical protein